ncbi:MAG: hypothetical protein IPN86_20600 [Saprospiraceae bacterium]|nr:hypothetical protein [Saprospiraceae bacterium]
MNSKTIDIEAQIKVLPFSETGRAMENHMKIDVYFPIFKFDNMLNDVFLSHPTKRILKSADATKINISFKFPILQIGRLSKGDKFEITEGKRTTMIGEILRVINPIMDKYKFQSNISQSIEELENSKWETPLEYQSSIVENCHLLRKKPINKLSDEELRLSLSQDVGIKFTIPIILNKLLKNKYIECDFYPGDLLQETFRRLHTDWGDSELLKDHFTFLIRHNFKEIKSHEGISEKVKREIFNNLVEYENTRDNK